MIPDITELNFPKIDRKQYATLTQATANIADMGEKTITTQVKIDGDIVPDFSKDWEVEFQGEKYIMPLRIPQGAKENTSLNSTIDLTFQHWAIYQLKRWPFVTIQPIEAGTYIADEEVATVQLNLKDFCILFGQVLEYYYGGAITIDFNDDPVTGWKYKQEATIITISHTKIWNVLIDAFHGKYGVRWEIKARNYQSGKTDGKTAWFVGSFNESSSAGISWEDTIYSSSQYLRHRDLIPCRDSITVKADIGTRFAVLQFDENGKYLGISTYNGLMNFDASDFKYIEFDKRTRSIGLIFGKADGSDITTDFLDSHSIEIHTNLYVIRVGYPTTEVDHIFEYGFEGGLLKVERQVQSEEIRNMLKGRGGETNIPRFYFKQVPEAEKEKYSYRDDPDWVEELANIHFPNLMGATFRSYVQGWKAAHISKYPGYKAVGESNAYAPWAYRKGYTDTKFAPVEFVADEITINTGTGDKQVEILPGYSPYVKKGSSLDKYGPLPDTLDNNDDIYPTLQGTGLDIAVAVEQIESDDVEESAENDAKISDIPDGERVYVFRRVAPSASATKTLDRINFTVESGKHAIFIDDARILKAVIPGTGGGRGTAARPVDIATNTEQNVEVNVYNSLTGEQRSASGIPAGNWYCEISVTVRNISQHYLDITAGTETPKLESATLDDDSWKNTFDIWVKNIWDTQKGIAEDGTEITGETDEEYAERVWKPVLGDREGKEAAVMFTSGALVHEDYEFKIPKGAWPVYDTSETWEEKDDNGVVIATHTSHWRIKLAKSEAELEATGLYVPSTKKQGKAGDRFVFIGTEMTHVPYVVDAEERLDDWKKDQLGEKKEIKPTAVVTTDRVRLNNEGKPNALINQLRVGNSLRLFDKRFFNEEGKAYETLYLQSITYTYREPSSNDAALNPDVQIVLGNEYATSANPVSMMQGEISALKKQLRSISNVEQIVRAVGDRLYLRKDGISDRSLSPTQFFSLLTSGDFRAGLIGGTGWGFYKDENGNWVLEADRVNARQKMSVNTLVINQAEGRGGMEIDTAAYINGVTRVVETDNGYVCYFDQKNGSVANLFQVDDVALCNQWTPENEGLKFYKRRVTAVSSESVTLSKTDVNGTDIPVAGDNIIHYGNYTDKERQYVKVRDVVGGGYERYIEELNSVNATGVEYYFVGKQAGENRWFVGNKDLVPYSGDGDGSYIEYINREFNLHNVVLSVGSKVGDRELGTLIQGYDDSKYLREALEQSTVVNNGLLLTSAILLGRTTGTGREIWAGHNGLYDNPKTIASFWGGGMVDRFYDENGNVRDVPLASGFAASLVRMDGSFYFANGNIGGETDGSAWFGGQSGFRIDAQGNVTMGNGVTISLADGSEKGIVDTLQSLTNFNIGITRLLVPCDANGNDLPGGWQEAFQHDGSSNPEAIKAKSLRAKVGLWTDEYISVGKRNPNGTGGGTGGSFGRLDDWVNYNPEGTDALSAVLGYGLKTDIESINTRIDNLPTTSVNPHALTIKKNGMTLGIYDGAIPVEVNIETAWGEISGKPVSLAGYGITDAYTRIEADSRYLQTSSYTAADVLAKIKTVDGAGSGLDADLLDGHHKNDFNGVARFGTTAMHSTGYYKIKIKNPGGWMLAFKILAYQSYRLTEITVCGYNRGSYHWHAPAASLSSQGGTTVTDSVQVTFGYDSDWHLWVAIPAGNYAGISVTDVANGYNQIADVHDLFEIVYEETLTGMVQTQITATRHATLLDTVASADRLSDTGTYTAWGNTFFENGKPKRIEGSSLTLYKATGMEGWARSVQAADSNGAVMGSFGLRGVGQTLLYAYIGKSYDAPWLAVTPAGHVGIGTTEPTCPLEVNGAVRINGLLTVSEGISTTDITMSGGLNMGPSRIQNGNDFISLLKGSEAQRLLTGGLLASYLYSDRTKIPAYGIFSRGDIETAGSMIVNTALTTGGSVSVGDTLTVSGMTTLVGMAEALEDFHVTGLFACDGGIAVTGESNFASNVNIYADVLIDSSLYVMAGIHSEGGIHSETGLSTDGYISARKTGTVSDMRLKDVTGTLDLDIRDIANAPCMNFRWKKDGLPDIGSSAQYFQNINPLFTPQSPNGHLTLQYGKLALLYLIPTAGMVTDHESRISILEEDNRILKEENRKLKEIIEYRI